MSMKYGHRVLLTTSFYFMSIPERRDEKFITRTIMAVPGKETEMWVYFKQ
jgi:hypothetical protein